MNAISLRHLKTHWALLVLLCFIPQSIWCGECSHTVSKASPVEIRRGFTMTELLVTITVIGTLVAILIPALSKARQSAKNVKCLSNLRQAITSTHAYVNDYKVLPVHTIVNGSIPYAGVNLPEAFEFYSEGVNAWQCPSDFGFPNPSSGWTLYRSYNYTGIYAMGSPNPPHYFYAENALRRYEAEYTKPLYDRLFVYGDFWPFHESREGPSYYRDGKRNAVWWDGSAQRVPPRPAGP